MGSYFFFCQERRKTEKEKGLTIKTKALSREWKKLDENDKKKYENMRDLKKKEFEIADEKYKNSKEYKNYLNKLEVWMENNDYERPNTRSYAKKTRAKKHKKKRK